MSVVTVNVNRLNFQIKRHRIPEWIEKQDPEIHYLQETHFRIRDSQAESKGMEKDIAYKL